MGSPNRREVARRRGRRAGIVVFGVVVAAFTVVCSVEIILQVWFPPVGEPFATCQAAIAELSAAVERADRAAQESGGTEVEALRVFRETAGPSWQRHPAAQRACAENPAEREALAALVALRYAEEHAIRYEAIELHRRRARFQTAMKRLPGDPGR